MASASAQPAALSAEQAKGEEPPVGVGRLGGLGRALYRPVRLQVGPVPIREKGWEDQLVGLLIGRLGPLTLCLFPPLGSPATLHGPRWDASVFQWS